MIIESFIGMMLADENGLRGVGREPCDWIVLHLRLGAAPVGVAGIRSVSRARAGGRRWPAVRNPGEALGLCLLRRILVHAVRRSPVDRSRRPSNPERVDAAAGLLACGAVVRPPFCF